MKGLTVLSSALALVACVFASAAAAQDLSVRWLAKDGAVIAERTLDIARVEAFPQKQIVTTTPWAEGDQTFTGPSLADIAVLVERPVASAHVWALNDYTADLPADHWARLGAILAVRQNGEIMKIRDKGPFWVMYPMSSAAELDTQYYHSRMVWQVRGVDFIAE